MSIPADDLASRGSVFPDGRLAGIIRTAFLVTTICLATANFADAQGTNPGDALFCQPNEGLAFLIVNGGSGIFTVSPQCYNNDINNDTDTTITTSQGGTLTLTRTPFGGNYTYTPPTPTFTGLDTFSIHVTTVWNSAGDPGSAGGTEPPGGPATLTVTLNVIPAATTLPVSPATPALVPVPPGSISNCSAPPSLSGSPCSPLGGGLTGPPEGALASAVYGCVTAIQTGTVVPSHGTLQVTGNTLRYTPGAGFTGTDTFSYQALGVNNDGGTALNSGDVTVQVTVGISATPLPSTGILTLFAVASLWIYAMTRKHGEQGPT